MRSSRPLRRLPALFPLAFVLAIPGCAGPAMEDPAANGNSPAARAPAAAQVDPRLARATDDFAFRAFAALLRESGPENVFISPLGLSVSLSMLLNGAGGDTRSEMESALGIAGIPARDVNQAYRELVSRFPPENEDLELRMATGLWAADDRELHPEFDRVARDDFAARAESIRFTDPDAADRLNAWVREQTRERIPEIVRPTDLNEDTLLVVLNALYFRGRWQEQFLEARTRDGEFTRGDGSKKLLPMMSRDGVLPYVEDDGFQAVALPYRGERVRMYVVLPPAGAALADFGDRLDPAHWDALREALAPRDIDLVLPRFRLEYEQDMIPMLRALGMRLAFDDQADFTGLFSPPEQALVTTVRQKTFLQVDEEGSEAAAATQTGVGIVSVPVRPSMVVDRPFFCVLRDEQTGVILFLGAVHDPDAF